MVKSDDLIFCSTLFLLLLNWLITMKKFPHPYESECTFSLLLTERKFEKHQGASANQRRETNTPVVC